ncbi:hypothetical protein CNMCM5623_002079 [Aspergillus felis]|uniref:ubiquitinyl hydrolase 1 n=1 Tax=Aspergillus felis TaxID=1287682 RepID=A0A8H6QAB8_9EURO|nr:hypothetical protein CNMCM5623_002079 [Aspergillus felis]
MAEPNIVALTFNHVALPPRLPGNHDSNTDTEKVNRELVVRLLWSVDALRSACDKLAIWNAIEKLLRTCTRLNGNTFINRDAALCAFKEIVPGDALILHIAQQNACLCLRRPCDDEDVVVIEAFETSPTTEQTLAADGALSWDFPGQAVLLPLHDFSDPLFQSNFAALLEKASTEPIYEFAAKTRKAGAEVSEARDSTEPGFITQFLMTFVAANGERACPPLLRKRVRDDVCWNNAELPWRRSPFWLVLRVCIERMLIFRLGEALGRLYYKVLLCALMSGLLDDAVNHLSPEDCHFLKTKLCRRLAKLEVEKENCTASVADSYRNLLSAVGQMCQKSVSNATTALELEWKSFKRSLERKIPSLPLYAHQNDLEISLRNSAAFFHSILKPPQKIPWQPLSIDSQQLTCNIQKATTNAFLDLVTNYSALADRERAIESKAREAPRTKVDCEALCMNLASTIEGYLNTASNAYQDDPEQMGIFILNLFEMWVHMDKCATAVCPLLKSYHPWVKPELFDVILLSRLSDMERLQKIQVYINIRCKQARADRRAIFDDPSPRCFADRYFDSEDGEPMHQLQRKIKAASLKAREDKVAELERINNEFRDLTEKKTMNACTQRLHPDGTHDIRGCSHCYYIRRRRRLKIDVHEDFLPPDDDTARQRAVVFELNLPKWFDAYRAATWNTIATLTRAPTDGPSDFGDPEMLLGSYSQLKNYHTTRKNEGLTLASFSKSYLKTHYSWNALPARSSTVLLPSEKILTFAHHFSISLPQQNPFAALYSSVLFEVEGPGPTSYEALASADKCPPHLSLHEYQASHHLMGGKNRRWISMLIELGSSNIDFSLQDTVALVRLLALQVGPGLENDSLRAVHIVFRDVQFCRRLNEILHRHIDIVSANWREVNYMETMLILALQLWSYCCSAARFDAYELICRVRRVTLSWIHLLRDLMRNSEEADTAAQAARHCFLSALLCRRTFLPQAYENYAMTAQDFKVFLETSLAMQESLVVDLTKFSSMTRSMLVRDIKMGAVMRDRLGVWMKQHPSAVNEALDSTWPASSRSYTDWNFTPISNDTCWVTATAQDSDGDGNPQVVHLHLLQGHLLLDGQTIGKLPTDITDSDLLKTLFGNQRLFAFPSNMAGMRYVLALNKEGYQIHLGYRSKQLVVRAVKSGLILELVPRVVFGQGSGLDLDLPATLVEECVHWLDINSGILYVRRQARMWNDDFWVLNLRSRRAQRKRMSLIDQCSSIFRSITQIFRHFEDPCNIMVTQPLNGPLCVDLKRMNLTFYVNKKNLLQCKQLSAEVDPNQDAGTFYGLQSMLVLRNVYNRAQRSIIVPLGELEYIRKGMHVAVRIRNTGLYARYIVDNVLGRLQSPQDLQILYTKALLHAFTSSFIPDTLTGQTGTEESLRSLQTGQFQPWNPLTELEIRILQSIADLTARREYYPKDRKCQQIVHWNQNLTSFIQHDGYRPAVDTILLKSKRLTSFAVDSPEPSVTSTKDPKPTNVPHLCQRAFWRRSFYERTSSFHQAIGMHQPKDFRYNSRDGWVSNRRTGNVREIVNLIRLRPRSIHTTDSLEKLLQKWPLIGGYSTSFNLNTLDDYLSVELPHHWGALVKLCKASPIREKFDILFKLALIAFRNGIDMTVLRVIGAFYVLEDLKALELPEYPSFAKFEVGEVPTAKLISDLAMPYLEPFQEAPPPRKRNRRQQVATGRAKPTLAEHQKRCDDALRTFTDFLLGQWPCSVPSIDGLAIDIECLNVPQAALAINKEWGRLFANLQLHNHLQKVQLILNKHYSSDKPVIAKWPDLDCEDVLGTLTRCEFHLPRLNEDLLHRPGPSIDVYHSSLEGLRKLAKAKVISPSLPSFPSSTRGSGSPGFLGFASASIRGNHNSEVAEVESIVDGLLNTKCPVKLQYGRDLKKSISSLSLLRSPESMGLDLDFEKGVEPLNAEIWAARTAINQRREQITNALSRGNCTYIWLRQGNLWPCTMPVPLLQQLRSTSQCRFGPGMENALVSYGQSILNLQRLIRIKEALAKRDKARLHQEMCESGHTNWQPYNFPDWLLLELDANILIREEQVTVALEMIDPSSNANSVLQMNMGRGKTSVIMPMVAAVLADGKMLARLLVPKALLSQTAQILQSRLGGLLGREITNVPFSRRTPTTADVIEEYRHLHMESLYGSGIILGIPEHVLSFKLSGLQRLSDSKISQAADMIGTQHFLDLVCRDILDECDFSLAVRTQLIYPSGSQLAVDGHPYRWEVTMAILASVAHHLPGLANDFPCSIDVMNRPATDFPVAYFLRDDAERALLKRLVDDICDGQTCFLPVAQCESHELQSLRIFISQETVETSVSKHVSNMFPDKPHLRKIIYLLRGLLVHGILLLCLKKRWNVQYGLHPTRDPMAVPFLAKGVPSDQAEWGHPDVAILFTCLAFYHQGLSLKQLRQILQAVLRSDDPTSEYDRWTQTSTALPESLRHWNIINVDDAGQVYEIWRHLRFRKVVIDYFLKSFVFPVHAKQFSIKLQASGWDIPLFGKTEQLPEDDYPKQAGITTGFSGTNDNRRLLPLTIEQHDLPELAHTNAEVLTYLLQRRNRQYMVAAGSDGRRLSEHDLLDHLRLKKIRILIDAGAYILEMDNHTLARAWLQQDQEALAAVYFGEDNRPWVQYQTGKVALLIATPFVDNMDRCLVYLDEAHTRGTDLKLPLDARGALTLALHQTKDHTVQAAMRLRQLGTTQSITFVAPPEVHQSILDVGNKQTTDRIDSSDVIAWLLHQTCATNKDLLPLYYAQGADFCYRMQAAATYEKFLTSKNHRERFLDYLQQPEQQTLEQLYDPQTRKNCEAASAGEELKLRGVLETFMRDLGRHRDLIQEQYSSAHTSALEEVEQEREVAYEVQEERELQRARPRKALTFPGIHPAILSFVHSGALEGKVGFLRASQIPLSTELALKHGLKELSIISRLYVSEEMIRSIELRRGERNDSYTRPVNWILWSMKTETALVIIPEEAEALIPVIRSMETPRVHLILYAAPFTKRMLRFNRLNFYAIPCLPEGWNAPLWLRFEIGILAGRLYFEFDEYQDLLERLHVGPEGNLRRTKDTTLQFLHEWLALRRHGQDISHTPMGYVCQRWRIRPDHPFFSTTQEADENNATELFSSAKHNIVTAVDEVFYDSDDEEVVTLEGDDGASDHAGEMYNLADGLEGIQFN